MAYNSYLTSYIAQSPSGSVTVRAWGSGADADNSVEKAKLNAVSDIIFRGIKGATGSAAYPIINEVNARERHSSYFDNFFSPDGKFLRFVKVVGPQKQSRIKAKSTGRESSGILVEINRNGLEQQLITDGILKR